MNGSVLAGQIAGMVTKEETAKRERQVVDAMEGMLRESMKKGATT